MTSETKANAMLTMTDRRIQIKGIRDGLLVTFGEGDWNELREALLDYIGQQAGFFKGARMAIDVGNHILHAAEMSSLRNKLSDYEVALWAVLSNSPVTERTAQVLGLATRLPTPRMERAHHRGGECCPGTAYIALRLSFEHAWACGDYWRGESRCGNLCRWQRRGMGSTTGHRSRRCRG
jgi:hypothetical protein